MQIREGREPSQSTATFVFINVSPYATNVLRTTRPVTKTDRLFGLALRSADLVMFMPANIALLWNTWSIECDSCLQTIATAWDYNDLYDDEEINESGGSSHGHSDDLQVVDARPATSGTAKLFVRATIDVSHRDQEIRELKEKVRHLGAQVNPLLPYPVLINFFQDVVALYPSRPTNLPALVKSFCSFEDVVAPLLQALH
nr:hypothetical protein Iba_chr12cCG13870 [Ipomoea batatas]